MTKLIFWGPTALEFYERVPNLSFERTSLPLEKSDTAPTPSSVRYLSERFPWLSTPYHLMVGTRQERRSLPESRCHLAVESLKSAHFAHVEAGIFAPAPEVALLQASWGHSVEDVAFRGTILCSPFYVDSHTDELVERRPSASIQSITVSCGLHGDIRGCTMAKRALPWMLEGAASPREAALALLMSLPNRLGGYHLPSPQLNQTIELTCKGRKLASKSYYIADICWPDQKLVIEYDSDTCHLTSEQLREDAIKRMTLESMGYQVITIGRLQLNSVSETRNAALAAARALGTPIRFRVQGFEQKHQALRCALSLPANP